MSSPRLPGSGMLTLIDDGGQFGETLKETCGFNVTAVTLSQTGEMKMAHI